MSNTFIFKIGRKKFVVFNRDSSDEHWLAFPIQLSDFSSNGFQLARLCLENLVVMVSPGYRLMSRDNESFQTVDFIKLFLRSDSGTSHTGEFPVHAKIILESDGGIRAALFLNTHTLLGLYSLVQSFRPTPTGLKPTSKRIHNDDLVIFDHIFCIFVV